jgi:hypothetical protein
MGRWLRTSAGTLLVIGVSSCLLLAAAANYVFGGEGWAIGPIVFDRAAFFLYWTCVPIGCWIAARKNRDLLGGALLGLFLGPLGLLIEAFLARRPVQPG